MECEDAHTVPFHFQIHPQINSLIESGSSLLAPQGSCWLDLANSVCVCVCKTANINFCFLHCTRSKVVTLICILRRRLAPRATSSQTLSTHLDGLLFMRSKTRPKATTVSKWNRLQLMYLINLVSQCYSKWLWVNGSRVGCALTYPKPGLWVKFSATVFLRFSWSKWNRVSVLI